MYVLTLKVTSKPQRTYDKYDYQLVYWQAANLSAPSVVRVSKLAQLKPEAFGSRIGRLSSFDAMNIQNLMKCYNKSR